MVKSATRKHGAKRRSLRQQPQKKAKAAAKVPTCNEDVPARYRIRMRLNTRKLRTHDGEINAVKMAVGAIVHALDLQPTQQAFKRIDHILDSNRMALYDNKDIPLEEWEAHTEGLDYFLSILHRESNLPDIDAA